MTGFKEYIKFCEIADNFGIEPSPQQIPLKKAPLHGIWNDEEKPPTAKTRKKLTRKEIFAQG